MKPIDTDRPRGRDRGRDRDIQTHTCESHIEEEEEEEEEEGLYLRIETRKRGGHSDAYQGGRGTARLSVSKYAHTAACWGFRGSGFRL